jgi:two-component system, chemotaxis family, sensor kinase CheA
MDDVVREFLVESSENLDRLDREFVELEKNPSQEALANIFRAIHTIKGTCGFLSFGKLESVTHAGENLLSLLRDGKIAVTPTITDALLALVDAVRAMLASIESSGNDGDNEYASLIERLGQFQINQNPFEAPPKPSRRQTTAVKKVTGKTQPKAKTEATPAPFPSVAPMATAKPQLGDILIHQGHASLQEIDRALEAQVKGDPRQLGEILVEQRVVKPAEVLAALQTQREGKSAAVSDSTVRVDVGLLDKLMNLVGELVLSRNQIMQFAAVQDDASFLATSQHLNLVTTELQEGVMKTRMQPIGNVWNKFPRLVRDLAAACAKQAEVELEGADTELDRTIIEAIKDPLTHLVRNSIDHGIESPAERLALGKAAAGRLLLRAYHEGGQVIIEITDDGGGINPEKICARALQKGLITPEHAARMGERELINLVFLPGFTTAEKVTNVSGRGVGMDVVKTNIEKIGGSVDIQSKIDQGTHLKIKIPLTLAIIPALMVSAGDERYAIPQVSLLELVRLEGDQARKGIEMIHGAPVYRLRGNLLPLVYLRQVLKLPERQNGNDIINVAVLQADGRPFGLVVDGINDSKDIVVKPLGRHLKGLSAFSGATILGDGKMALILDIIGISMSANVTGENRQPSHKTETVIVEESLGNRRALLICRFGKNYFLGIDLSSVGRLEKFPLTAIERSGAHEVVQYRGEIMPLLRLAPVLGFGAEGDPAEALEVVVYREGDKSLGLVVDQIADIVEERITVQNEQRSDYLLGTVVVQGRVTDILDVRSVIQAVLPEYLAGAQAA